MEANPIVLDDTAGDVVVVVVEGEHDIYTAPTLRERLEEALDRGGGIVVDLTAATFVDSSVLGALLDALRRHGSLHEFVPLDVSETALREAVDAIVGDHAGLRVHGVVGDFTAELAGLPGDSPRLVAFLGGTIGNLLPAERHGFLTSVRKVLDDGEWLLLGTDLVKDPQTLVQAYDDAAGVTAEFNRNVLRVLNRELNADFDPEAFEHLAPFDEANKWIEMRLISRKAQTVWLEDLGRRVEFAAGECLRTEVSCKFCREQVQAELGDAGLDLAAWWTDADGDFALSLAMKR